MSFAQPSGDSSDVVNVGNRCEFCISITFSNTRDTSWDRKGSKVYEFWHQPSYKALWESAKSGCDVCQAFASALERDLGSDSILKAADEGASTSITVRAAERIASIVPTNDSDGTMHMYIDVDVAASSGMEESQYLGRRHVMQGKHSPPLGIKLTDYR
jgi:hypothetical protein